MNRTPAPLLLLAALLTACGGAAGGGASSSAVSGGHGGSASASASAPAPATSAPVAAKATSLTIQIWSDGRSGAPDVTHRLTCDPPGGTVPNAAAACSTLVAAGDRNPFAPAPGNVECTELYGGPEVARVTGVLTGVPVQATIRRTDGCEIARWNRLASILEGAGRGGTQRLPDPPAPAPPGGSADPVSSGGGTRTGGPVTDGQAGVAPPSTRGPDSATPAPAPIVPPPTDGSR